MAKHYELLIFDWHGTLLDSCHHIAESMQATITEMDWPQMEKEKIKQMIGCNMFEILQNLYPDQTDRQRASFIEKYRKHFFAGKHHSQLYPGIYETLEMLKQEGYLLALATSEVRERVERKLAKFNLSDFFAAICCGDEAHAKPHPEMIERLLTLLNVAPERALMIGDTEFDMQLAINAKVDAVAVDCGVHDRERLVHCHPLACLSSVSELPIFLAKVDWGMA